MNPEAIPLSPERILRHIKDGLMIVDLEGRILYTNDSFREMFGHGDVDLRRRRCSEVFGPDECSRIHPGSIGPFSDEPIAHFNVKLTRRDGVEGAYCFMACPLLDESGEVIAVMENFRGMDQLMEIILGLEQVNAVIQQEKERTEQIVNSIGDGIFTVDRETRLLSFSPKMEEITGIRAIDAIGKFCRDALCGTKCDSDCPLIWTLENKKIVDGCREKLSGAGGRKVPVSITTAFLRDNSGQEIGLTAVVGDLSEVERLRSELKERYSFRSIIGSSRAMTEVFQVIESVSDTDATVLITGDSGTGKELVARAIHYGSARASEPFVVVNCAALNDTLLESELFGHVRGAFTGAERDKEGRFEAADGGTLFLDEVGDTSPAMQAKLLRVLQEKSFERVGDSRTHRVNVRVLAATNRDLEARVGAGQFREDLFYRLNVVPIRVPALKERRDDIPLLVDHFMEKYAKKYYAERAETFGGVTNRALGLLMEYGWPGNVRELEHAIEYAMISARNNRIERAYLPAVIRGLALPPGSPGAPELVVARVTPGGGEEQGLRELLERHRWNASRAAKELGISRTTLWRRMKKHDLLQKHS